MLTLLPVAFRPGGPKPWKTKLGHSKLDERRSSVEAEQRKASLREEGKDEVVRAVRNLLGITPSEPLLIIPDKF
jgi:hypothetical protein